MAVYESCMVFVYRGVPWGVGVPDLCGGLTRSPQLKQVSGLEVHSRSPPAALHHVLFHTRIVNIDLPIMFCFTHGLSTLIYLA